MKKKFMITSIAGIMAAAMSMTVFAAGWQQNETGRWWQNDDGTWYSNGWQWIDDNGDGTAECYYFDENGYMLAGTTTPDGYTVNADGAWIQDGVIMTVTGNGESSNKKEQTIISHEVENKNFADIQGYSFYVDNVRYMVDMYGNPLKNVTLAGGKFSTDEEGRLLYKGELISHHVILGSIDEKWQTDDSKPSNDRGISNRYYTCRTEFEVNGQKIVDDLPMISEWAYIKNESNEYKRAYCFNEQGYLYASAITPDGYTVNENGQLVIDGKVVNHTWNCSDASWQLLSFTHFNIGDLRWKHLGGSDNEGWFEE